MRHYRVAVLAAEQGVAPVEALELKVLHKRLFVINVRLAGERRRYPDKADTGGVV
jgi:hypothetical protein